MANHLVASHPEDYQILLKAEQEAPRPSTSQQTIENAFWWYGPYLTPVPVPSHPYPYPYQKKYPRTRTGTGPNPNYLPTILLQILHNGK